MPFLSKGERAQDESLWIRIGLAHFQNFSLTHPIWNLGQTWGFPASSFTEEECLPVLQCRLKRPSLVEFSSHGASQRSPEARAGFAR